MRDFCSHCNTYDILDAEFRLCVECWDDNTPQDVADRNRRQRMSAWGKEYRQRPAVKARRAEYQREYIRRYNSGRRKRQQEADWRKRAKESGHLSAYNRQYYADHREEIRRRNREYYHQKRKGHGII